MNKSKVCLLPFAGLLWLACCHGLVHAAASGTTPALPLSDTTGARPVEPPSLATLTSWEQLIAALQTRQPAFGVAVELGEAYYGLGGTLQTLGRHDEAIEAFDKALQALRENKGLYELAQLPVLQVRFDSSVALAAWEEVDAGLHLAHEITLKNPAAGSEQRYQTLRELGLWKLRAAEEELLPNALGAVSEAAVLYRRELEQPEVRSAYRGLSLANLYLDLAALEFLQARKKLELPLTAYAEGGQRMIMQLHCELIQTPDGRVRQVCRNIRVPNMDYFMALSDRKYWDARSHLDAMKSAVLEAYNLLLREVESPDRDAALALLSEVHRLTGAFNDFVAENARRTETRIAPPTGSRISH